MRLCSDGQAALPSSDRSLVHFAVRLRAPRKADPCVLLSLPFRLCHTDTLLDSSVTLTWWHSQSNI